MTDFALACAAWQVSTCPEFGAVSAEVDRLNSELGCAMTLQFANLVWYHPALLNNAQWLTTTVREWLAAYREYGETVQPHGWNGNRAGPGYEGAPGYAGGGRPAPPKLHLPI